MYLVIDAMAEKYSMLPTEVLSRATTLDLFIYNVTNIIKAREHAKKHGENITHTYQKEELEDMYKQFKERNG